MLMQIVSKRGQQRTVEQIMDVFEKRRGGEVGSTSTNASTDR